jgi:FkbM family methyltransferase
MSEIFSWRARILLRALRGHLATSSITDLARSMGPGRLRSLQSSVELGQTCWRTPFGPFYGPADDQHGRAVLSHMVNEHLWNVYERGGVSIHEGDVVLDVGANIGMFTRLALRLGAGKVISFEPNRKNADCFRRTFRGELASGQVVLLEAAAWCEADTLCFEREDTTFRISSESTAVLVRAVKIDDAVAELKLPRVDFIKMDIEGAERHALEGAARTIAEFHPRMALCIYHLPDDPAAITSKVMTANPSYKTMANEEQAFFW